MSGSCRRLSVWRTRIPWDKKRSVTESEAKQYRQQRADPVSDCRVSLWAARDARLSFDLRGFLVKALLLTLLIVVLFLPARVHAGGQTVKIGWLSQTEKRTLPLTYLDQPPEDEGIQGARLGIADDTTTGQFTGQSFELVEGVAPGRLVHPDDRRTRAEYDNKTR